MAHVVETFRGHPCRYWTSSTSSSSAVGTTKRGVWNLIVSLFVPDGTITEDYFRYQAWDSVQGLCSYIRGMLSSQAMLTGMGVGQSSATAQSAVFTIFLRDMSGTLGGVFFAASSGSGLDAFAKQWRFFADCLNNVGYFLEIFSPVFPSLFLLLACLGSLARAITGVAAGATRSALTQHFAVDGNAADVSAKEGSQESFVTLIGMLLGMLIVHLTAGSVTGVWATFLALTALHVYANFQAMRSLELTSLNRPRTDLIASYMLDNGEVPSASWVARHESLSLPFASKLWPGRLQSRHDCPKVRLGCSLADLEVGVRQNAMESLVKQPYVCIHYSSGGLSEASVLFSSSCTDRDILRAYLEALYVTRVQDKVGTSSKPVDEWVEEILRKMQDIGWNVSHPCLGASHWRLEQKDLHED